MKYVFWTSAFIITIIWIYLVIANLTAVGGITILDNGLAGALGTFPRRLALNMGLIICIIFLAGFTTAKLFLLPLLIQNKEKEGAYERRLEKTAVSNDESSAKVKVLDPAVRPPDARIRYRVPAVSAPEHADRKCCCHPRSLTQAGKPG